MRLIDADALLSIYKGWLPQLTAPEDTWDRNGVETCIAVLQDAPTIEAEPVKHGRWTERKSFHAEGGIVAKCSACQKDVQYLGNPLKFCPNCGAKMDGCNDE